MKYKSISNSNFYKKIDNFIINSPNYNFLSNKNKINYKSLKIENKYIENKDYLKIEYNILGSKIIKSDNIVLVNRSKKI